MAAQSVGSSNTKFLTQILEACHSARKAQAGPAAAVLSTSVKVVEERKASGGLVELSHLKGRMRQVFDQCHRLKNAVYNMLLALDRAWVSTYGKGEKAAEARFPALDEASEYNALSRELVALSSDCKEIAQSNAMLRPSAASVQKSH